MNGLKIARNYKTADGWNTAVITKEERSELDDKIREAQIDIGRECIIDARDVLGVSSTRNLVKLAVAMFLKRCPDTFTIYQTYLDEKVRELRESENAPDENEQQLVEQV